MKILALEFSSQIRSVALIERTAAGATLIGEVSEALDRHSGPLELVEKLLTQTRTTRGSIAGLAVGLGPGSYTGIRSSIAVAQGWQLARGIGAAGISSADAVADSLNSAGLSGLVHVAIDAQRGEFYLATFELAEGEVRIDVPLRIAAPDVVQASIARGEIVAGPNLSRAFPEARDVAPRASFVGLRAAAQDRFGPAETLTPIYLRTAQFVKAPPPRRID